MYVVLMGILLDLLPLPIRAGANILLPRRRPCVPARRIALQKIPCQNAIAACVLHVDVQVWAFHGDDHVQVDLEVVRDAFFNAEGVCRCAD